MKTGRLAKPLDQIIVGRVWWMGCIAPVQCNAGPNEGVHKGVQPRGVSKRPNRRGSRSRRGAQSALRRLSKRAMARAAPKATLSSPPQPLTLEKPAGRKLRADEYSRALVNRFKEVQGLMRKIIDDARRFPDFDARLDGLRHKRNRLRRQWLSLAASRSRDSPAFCALRFEALVDGIDKFYQRRRHRISSIYDGSPPPLVQADGNTPVRDHVVCLNCHRVVKVAAPFCRSCGSRVIDTDRPKGKNRRFERKQPVSSGKARIPAPDRRGEAERHSGPALKTCPHCWVKNKGTLHISRCKYRDLPSSAPRR